MPPPSQSSAMCQSGIGVYWGNASDPNAIAVIETVAPAAPGAPIAPTSPKTTPPDWFLRAAAARPGVIERFLAHWTEFPPKKTKAAEGGAP